jgi:hypothetical protein
MKLAPAKPGTGTSAADSVPLRSQSPFCFPKPGTGTSAADSVPLRSQSRFCFPRENQSGCV